MASPMSVITWVLESEEESERDQNDWGVRMTPSTVAVLKLDCGRHELWNVGGL